MKSRLGQSQIDLRFQEVRWPVARLPGKRTRKGLRIHTWNFGYWVLGVVKLI